MKRIVLTVLGLMLLLGSIMSSLPRGAKPFTAAIPFGTDSIVMGFHTGRWDSLAAIGYEEYKHTAIPEDTEGKLYIPDSVPFRGNMIPIRFLSRGSFQSCPRLTEIRLPKHLETISDLAFEGCVSLREITIPEPVVWIFPDAFVGCSSLRRVRFLPVTPPKGYNANNFDESVYATATLVIPAQSADAYSHSPLTYRFRYHAEVLPLYSEE